VSPLSSAAARSVDNFGAFAGDSGQRLRPPSGSKGSGRVSSGCEAWNTVQWY
jgi:hypothetical protein